MNRRRFGWIAIVLILCAAVLLYRHGRSLWHPVYRRLRGRRTVADVVARYGPRAEAALKKAFTAAGVTYPPRRIALLVFKKEKRLELWAGADGRWAFARSYPVTAASGHAGPKLREGDRQVPEGAYRVVALNPNSSYHLSMKLDYPNEADRRRAREDGRTDPGGDIFIHGKAVSIGCVAVGDRAIEELFVLTAAVGRANVEVLIAPNDLRDGRPAETHPSDPPWADERREAIRRRLAAFPRPAAALPHPSPLRACRNPTNPVEYRSLSAGD